ncbi:hypothetical protein O4220_00025 [Rhodococcus ruber]|uniref:Acetyltransferase n=1 Tax=Rhodococcus ruber TaxID=1830 RepID=A0ABT4M7F8_9NOCA|nr:DUF6640 family protein [Rhodococcus ruber]MCZ4516881.1 hypothetical protein [Rhodococcus ruber]
MTPATRRLLGKVLLTMGALVPAVGSFVADWSPTHVYNPSWPAHAKFHLGQTLALAAGSTVVSLYLTWRPGADVTRLRGALLAGAFFWLTQLPALLVPGAALTDPDTPIQPFDLGGLPVNQITVTGVVIVPLLLAGYALQRGAMADRAPARLPERAS